MRSTRALLLSPFCQPGQKGLTVILCLLPALNRDSLAGDEAATRGQADEHGAGAVRMGRPDLRAVAHLYGIDEDAGILWDALTPRACPV